MTKTINPPAVPLGARFDPSRSLIENARHAREADKQVRRSQSESRAKFLARRVFGIDEIEFDYQSKVGQDVPTFAVEGELIAFDGTQFLLIEFCSECGDNPASRHFSSLAQFGAALESRDDATAHVCRLCMAGQKRR